MNADFRRCLETLDVPGIRALWAKHSPHLSQPKDDAEALVALHMARTAAESLSIKDRAYSHRWLDERNLPSQLPDRLKRSADRLYPQNKYGVGVSFGFKSRELRPAAQLIQGAMCEAVLEAEADGRLLDDAHVIKRMNEARDREYRALFGRRIGAQ